MRCACSSSIRAESRFLELGLTRNFLFFRLPALGQLGRLLLKVRKFLFKLLEAVLGRFVLFFLQRLALDLQLDDPPVKILDLLGLGLHLHADSACGLVHQIDRFVGEETIGDVAVGQGRRRHDRSIGDAHAVVKFVLLLEAAQDRDRVGNGRLADEHGLEAPLQRCVLLDMLAIFVERRRPDAVQLAPCEGGLQQVRRVHRTFGFSGADEGVHLVDEEDDVARGLADLVEDAFQSLFELAAIFRTRDQRTQIEGKEALVLDPVGDIAVGDA